MSDSGIFTQNGQFLFSASCKYRYLWYQRYPNPKLSKGFPVDTHPNQVYIMFPFKRMLELFIDRKSGAGFDVVQPDIAK